MDYNQTQHPFNLRRVVKKLLLSAFVLFTFILYAIHKPADNPLATANQDTTASGAQKATSQPTLPAPEVSVVAGAAAASASLQDAIPPATATAPAAPTETVPAVAATATQIPASPTVPPPTPTVKAPLAAGQYRDGTYTGVEVDAFYGLVKVQTTIQNGKIVDVKFLEFPQDRRTSQRINSYAVPYLQKEAIQAQNAQVNFISGATLTSQAFTVSLQSALNQAKS